MEEISPQCKLAQMQKAFTGPAPAVLSPGAEFLTAKRQSPPVADGSPIPTRPGSDPCPSQVVKGRRALVVAPFVEYQIAQEDESDVQHEGWDQLGVPAKTECSNPGLSEKARGRQALGRQAQLEGTIQALSG